MSPFIRLGGEGPAVLFEDHANGVTAGTILSGAGRSELAGQGFHEFTVIEQGEVFIDTPGGTQRLGPGAIAVLPRGLQGVWRQEGPVRRSFLHWAGPVAAGGAVVLIDPDGPLAPGAAPAAETVLTSPPPVARSRTDYRDPSGRFSAGIWECTAYRRRPVPSAQHEMMKIVSGTAVLETPDGVETLFPPGDTFLTMTGALYALGGRATFRKAFCIVRPG